MTGDYVQTLAGKFCIRAAGTPSIVGTRPIMSEGRIARVLRGMTGEQAATTLGRIFSLCASAHQQTAQLAVAAAQTGAVHDQTGHAALSLDVALDHLRAMALDWPVRLSHLAPPSNAATHASDWLRACPISLTARSSEDDATQTQLGKVAHWLEQDVLRMDLGQWLTQCHSAPQLHHWCTQNAARWQPAAFLAAAYPTRSMPLPRHSQKSLMQQSPTDIQQLGAAMATSEAFCQHPTWQGQPANSGAWSRIGSAYDVPGDLAWSRLAARLVELVRLAHGTSALAQAAYPLPAPEKKQAVACCQMARGLLLHWTELDEGGRILNYRIIAPTDWNFHPQGLLALALSALPTGDTDAAKTLLAAFDPCVPVQVETEGANHA